MTLIAAGLALTALTGFLAWLVCGRIWHALVIVALAAALFPLVVTKFTGDVSRFLPASAFAAGSDGKDQVVMASAVATVLVAIMLAACLFGVVKAAARWFTARR